MGLLNQVDQRLHLWSGLTVDKGAIALAVLLVGVTAASVAMVPVLQQPTETGEPAVSQSDELADKSAGEQAAAGGGWAVLEAVAAGLVLALFLMYRWLPEFWQDLIKDTAAYGAFMALGGHFALQGRFNWALGVALSAYVGFEIVDEAGLWWVINNVIALAVAVLVGAFAGVKLGVPFVLLGLIGLSVYDHYFANKQGWMLLAAEALLRVRLPVLVLWPDRWRFDWDDFAQRIGDSGDEELEDTISFGIGMADLMLPAMFAAAVAAYSGAVTLAGWPLPVWGVLAGLIVAAARLRFEMSTHGSGAGLPAITAGAIGGWAVGLAMAVPF